MIYIEHNYNLGCGAFSNIHFIHAVYLYLFAYEIIVYKCKPTTDSINVIYLNGHPFELCSLISMYAHTKIDIQTHTHSNTLSTFHFRRKKKWNERERLSNDRIKPLFLLSRVQIGFFPFICQNENPKISGK